MPSGATDNMICDGKKYECAIHCIGYLNSKYVIWASGKQLSRSLKYVLMNGGFGIEKSEGGFVTNTKLNISKLNKKKLLFEYFEYFPHFEATLRSWFKT